MANIVEKIKQIRQAVYGKDVRESIASSLEEMNKDNIEAIQSASEAIESANEANKKADESIQNANTAVEAANDAATSANTAARAANDIADDIKAKLDAGELNGKDGKDGVDGDGVPVGTMILFPTNTAPDKWLLCDGSTVSRSDYPELFNVIGTSYGEGDGSTTFTLPNEPNPLAYTKDNDTVQFIDHVPPLYVIIRAK